MPPHTASYCSLHDLVGKVCESGGSLQQRHCLGPFASAQAHPPVLSGPSLCFLPLTTWSRLSGPGMMSPQGDCLLLLCCGLALLLRVTSEGHCVSLIFLGLLALPIGWGDVRCL